MVWNAWHKNHVFPLLQNCCSLALDCTPMGCNAEEWDCALAVALSFNGWVRWTDQWTDFQEQCVAGPRVENPLSGIVCGWIRSSHSGFVGSRLLNGSKKKKNQQIFGNSLSCPRGWRIHWFGSSAGGFTVHAVGLLGLICWTGQYTDLQEPFNLSERVARLHLVGYSAGEFTQWTADTKATCCFQQLLLYGGGSHLCCDHSLPEARCLETLVVCERDCWTDNLCYNMLTVLHSLWLACCIDVSIHRGLSEVCRSSTRHVQETYNVQVLGSIPICQQDVWFVLFRFQFEFMFDSVSPVTWNLYQLPQTDLNKHSRSTRLQWANSIQSENMVCYSQWAASDDIKGKALRFKDSVPVDPIRCH